MSVPLFTCSVSGCGSVVGAGGGGATLQRRTVENRPESRDGTGAAWSAFQPVLCAGVGLPEGVLSSTDSTVMLQLLAHPLYLRVLLWPPCPPWLPDGGLTARTTIIFSPGAAGLTSAAQGPHPARGGRDGGLAELIRSRVGGPLFKSRLRGEAERFCGPLRSVCGCDWPRKARPGARSPEVGRGSGQAVGPGEAQVPRLSFSQPGWSSCPRADAGCLSVRLTHGPPFVSEHGHLLRR